MNDAQVARPDINALRDMPVERDGVGRVDLPLESKRKGRGRKKKKGSSKKSGRAPRKNY